MKIVTDLNLVDGWAWGWGADQVGGAEPGKRCDACHHKQRRPEHRYRGGRIWLCTPCARRTMERAFGRPVSELEEWMIFHRLASLAVPMPDHLAALYAG